MLVDFHNHVLPGVDDGARDAGETRSALLAMWDAGVHLVIATPHISAAAVTQDPEIAHYQARIERALDDTRRIAAMETPHLEVELGAEVLLDDPEFLLNDDRLRLAGGEFVLVEFSLFGAPPNAGDLLFRLRAQGYKPILGHPERYSGLSTRLIAHWHSTGALLQVNAGSLLGDYGPDARRKGWELLEAGLIDYICGDYHARGKYRVPAALAAIESRGGKKQREILVGNGVRLSRGELPRAVPSLKRRSWLGSLLRRN